MCDFWRYSGNVCQDFFCFFSFPHAYRKDTIKKATSLKLPIRLRTFQENQGARQFYEQHEFKILELTDGSGNEEHCPDMLYEWMV